MMRPFAVLSAAPRLAVAPWFAPWSGPEGLPRTGWGVLLAMAAGAALVLVLVPPLLRVAWWTGYLDHPEARKSHAQATPLLGGVAVAAATLIAAALAIARLGMPVPAAAWWWGAGAVAAVALGLVDDRFGMAPALKLLLQFGVAALFVAGGVYPGMRFGVWVAAPLALVWLVAMMNAVNFLDNMDGIVGGMSAVLAAGLGLLLFSWGRGAEAFFAFALAGAALAYLRYNFPPAGVFLGDTGSLFLGYTLGGLSLVAAHAGPDVEGSLAGLLILGYPLFDLSFVVVTRLRDGRKVYQGGRDHTTHRLSQLIGGPRATALGVYAWATALTATGVGAAQAHGLWEILPWLVAWALALFAFGLRLARVPVRAAAPAPAAPAATT
jgi:UDP-GlcNAc:undecaprenyl-phosphate GlcNAc-1-phosphate transferase